MQEVYKFICAHWETILSILLTIGSVVVFILRKKPVNSLDSSIYELAILAVKHAENKLGGLRGSEKLDLAIDLVCNNLKEIYPDLDITRYMPYIKYVIERILSTPQKKGDKK